MTPEDIANRFEYHVPDAARRETHEGIRREVRGLADKLNVLLPEGREKSLVVTHLEEVMFWANAAIARRA